MTRRFRDMSLTEDDVQTLVNDHPTLWERLIDGKQNPESGEWETDTTALDRFTDRAKRLLPLWRTWGLRDLKSNAALTKRVAEVVAELRRRADEYQYPECASDVNWANRALLDAADLVAEKLGVTP